MYELTLSQVIILSHFKNKSYVEPTKKIKLFVSYYCSWDENKIIIFFFFAKLSMPSFERITFFSSRRMIFLWTGFLTEKSWKIFCDSETFPTRSRHFEKFIIFIWIIIIRIELTFKMLFFERVLKIVSVSSVISIVSPPMIIIHHFFLIILLFFLK